MSSVHPAWRAGYSIWMPWFAGSGEPSAWIRIINAACRLLQNCARATLPRVVVARVRVIATRSPSRRRRARVLSAIARATGASPGAPPPSLILGVAEPGPMGSVGRPIADEIRKARSHVHVAGWHVAPWFALTRGRHRKEVRPLLAELAERVDVRVLVWAGSPLPLFRPDREDGEGIRHALGFGTRIKVALDAKERQMHCHHEKLVIVDDRVAFVGGIGLTSYGGDRWDTPEHVSRGALGWQDAAVLLRGPVVADVAEHFRLRWQETAGEELPAPKRPRRAGDVELQLVRTVPEKVYGALPRGHFRILEAYTRALRSA